MVDGGRWGARVVRSRPLHDHGIRISIDDFGTGFTSLAALPTLPLDELKVDQCFVMRSTTSPADQAIVRTVGELGHRLGLHVVAEGVETAEIAALLERDGHRPAPGVLLRQATHRGGAGRLRRSTAGSLGRSTLRRWARAGRMIPRIEAGDEP